MAAKLDNALGGIGWVMPWEAELLGMRKFGDSGVGDDSAGPGSRFGFAHKSTRSLSRSETRLLRSWIEDPAEPAKVMGRRDPV